MSTKEPKQTKQLKAGVKIKTKPAVVPKTRRIKTRREKLPIDVLDSKRISKWNIIFAVLFTGLLVATIINSYFKEFIVIPLPNFILKTIVPVILFIEVFIILIAFETYKVKFAPNVLRIILTVLTLLVLFPITLFKYHTRHSVKRIVFTGLLLWSLVFSFFSPYFGMIGKIRDLEEGLAEQEVGKSWFDSLFQGSAPFYIDGLLDLLDSLDLNDTLGNQEMATVRADTGSLDNYLYRWEIRDRYDSSSWEFVGSNTQRFALDPSEYGPPPAATVSELNISENILATSSLYSTAIDYNLLTTWSSYYSPHLFDVTTLGYSWDDFLRDENGTVSSQSGTTNIRFNKRKQLNLESTSTGIGFSGTYDYKTYFALDSAADKDFIRDNAISRSVGGFRTASFNETYVDFLQIPQNYDTISPLTWQTTKQWSRDGTGVNVYDHIIYILESILGMGFPTSAQSDNQGQDRAERFLDPAIQDRSFSAFVALAIMALRMSNIPARPVFGFAIGDGDSSERTLTLNNLYAWIEALIPINEGGTVFRWGQFQIGPYIDNGDFIYCENTLNSAYNVSVEFLSVIPQDPGVGEEVYVIDNYVDYTLRATVTSEGSPVIGASVQFATMSVADYQIAASNPAQLFDLTRELGSDISDGFGHASIIYNFDHVNYTELNFADQDATSYVLLGYVSLASMGGAGFVVMPEGYLSAVAMNTSKQVLPNPQNITESYDYYIVQKGRNYQISTILYEDVAHTTVLADRIVNYYILTQDDLTELIFGILDPQILLDNKIGEVFTDAFGNSTLHTNASVYDTLLTDTTYFVAASYGANYTYSVMLIVQAEKSTIDINATDLSNFDLDIYLYLEPPGGSATKMANEPLEVWIAPLTDYSTYVGSDPDALKSHLLSANSTGPYCQIVSPPGALTDSNGFYNDTFVVSSLNYGTGIFVVIVFYLSTWNTSSSFIIGSGPVWLVDPVEPNVGFLLYDTDVLNQAYLFSNDIGSSQGFIVTQFNNSKFRDVLEVKEWF
jgi:hypothetical protein